MKTILNTLARVLHAILTGLAQTSYMGLCDPIPRRRELHREAAARDRR
jgi:hypothetical protein